MTTIQIRSDIPLSDYEKTEIETTLLAELSDRVHSLIRVHIVQKRQYLKMKVLFQWAGYVIQQEQRALRVHKLLSKMIYKLKRKIQALSVRQSQTESKHIRELLSPPPDLSSPHVCIEKRHSYSTKPMSEKEALLQLKLRNFDFFLFQNIETLTWSVIYRQSNGTFACIET